VLLLLLLLLYCRYDLMNTATQKVEVKHLTSEEAKNSAHFKVGAAI
jgi:hypothetical protein